MKIKVGLLQVMKKKKRFGKAQLPLPDLKAKSRLNDFIGRHNLSQAIEVKFNC